MSFGQVKKLELTFAILKPHITAVPRIIKDIHYRILSNGFYIISTKKCLIDNKLAHEFYDEHRNKFFFNRLVTFMCSGPCYFHILARENAIQMWRDMMGPTKVFKTIFTDPDTIRGVHGLSDTRNATHGSDSPESAEREMKVFFPDFSISSWYESQHDQFINGNYEFQSKELIHVTHFGRNRKWIRAIKHNEKSRRLSGQKTNPSNNTLTIKSLHNLTSFL